jgi:predicted transcriptional regulator
MIDKILSHLTKWRTLIEITEHVPSETHDTGATVAKLLAAGRIERSETRPRGGGTIFKYRRTRHA